MNVRIPAWVACMAAGAMAAQGVAAPAPVAPAAKAFRVGDMRVVALRDALNVVPDDGSVFGVGEAAGAVAGVLAAAGAPTDRITLGVDALLVTMPGRVVLIDTGLGPKVGGVLLASLRLAGFGPDQVTDVLITHSHGDHVGGLVTAAGTLAFPNAKVRMSAPEWQWLSAQPNSRPLVDAIRASVVPFAPGAPVLPGIASVALPGHTPGHSGYRITSHRQSLLDIGDLAHSAVISLARPGWTIGYDTDAAAGRARRQAVLARLAETHERIFAPHFPFPGVGTVVKTASGYAWRPAAS